MIATIKDFFSQFIAADDTDASSSAHQHKLQVATAAVLMEMVRMDNRIADAELLAIRAALQQQFGLDAAQLDTLVQLAEQEVRQATDYFQFTSLINKHCAYEDKVRIVENLWLIAFVDGHLDSHEQHLMRKIVDLLYVQHGDNIAAKQRAREATGVAPG